jgi:uncharacterized protein YrzB (UPF0473 family)
MENEFENMDDGLDEEEMETIELVDENGDTQVFELLAAFDLDDCHYLAVSDPIEEENPESVEVFILKTETDEDGNDLYVSLDDEESDRAYEYFLSLVEAEDSEEE